jgi:metal-responsive CopG/Arc/MetJ family transcriptional regulator
MERQNVTLSLPKSLLKKAKALAAEEDKSLSEFIRESMNEKIKKTTGYKEAMQRQIKLMKKGFNMGTKGKIKWTKDELHERR